MNFRKYNIADIDIEIQEDCVVNVENQFKPFETDCTLNPVRIYFKKIGHRLEINKENLILEKDELFREYFLDSQYIRAFFFSGDEMYAKLYRLERNKWICEYIEKADYRLSKMNNLFSHIAFERIMLDNRAIILHASLIRVNGRGILFSGPSGIGKSTQADLWCQYEDAELINGDKVIIRNVDGVWYGYGSPFAGSSDVFKNERVPIEGIVFLNRAVDECSCRRLSLAESFRYLYLNTTLNSWNLEFMDCAMDLIQKIMDDVKLYELRNQKDYSSVKCLKQTLNLEVKL